MTEYKKPKAIADKDLEGAQGGIFIESWVNSVHKTGKSVSSVGGGIGGTNPKTKRPGSNMDVINEDE